LSVRDALLKQQYERPECIKKNLSSVPAAIAVPNLDLAEPARAMNTEIPARWRISRSVLGLTSQVSSGAPAMLTP
jgi:hypothetical protein